MTTLELILMGAFILLQMVVNVGLAIKLSHLREETNLTTKEMAAYKAYILSLKHPNTQSSIGLDQNKEA